MRFAPWSSPLLPLLAQAARRAERRAFSWSDWISDPRNSVFTVLILALLIGGGRKLLQARRARRLVARLAGPGVEPEQVYEAAEYGREGLVELFGLLEPHVARPLRDAAGATLAILWARDQLIPEEERALVSRGFEVRWRARRRYPRALRAPIPVSVTFGVPFLRDDGPGVRPENLEWSYRVVGSERASLERFGPWQAGPGWVEFALDPGDFPTDGPHRLVLEARARTAGLTSPWELDLPHAPFAFEFDPRLEVASLLTLPDSARAERFAHAVRLEPPDLPVGGDPRFIPLGEELALRDPPELVVTDPPCDLAHAASFEFEGVPDRLPSGPVLVARDRLPASGTARLPLTLDPAGPPLPLSRPGEYRVRLHLDADPHLGWSDPDTRAVWPEPIVTPWATVRVVRR